jgi:hypothetical protein
MNRAGLEVRIPEQVSDAKRGEIEGIVNTLPDLETVINSWLKDPLHSLTVCAAYEDEDPEKKLLALILRECEGQEFNEAVVAEILFPFEWMKERYAGWGDIDTFIRGFESESGQTLLDDEAFDQWNASLGLRYNDFFAHELGPRSACLPLLVAYVITHRSDVSITPIPEFFYEDYSPEEIASEGIGPRERYRCFSASVQIDVVINGMRPGFFVNHLLDWDAKQPVSHRSQTGAQSALPA